MLFLLSIEAAVIVVLAEKAAQTPSQSDPLAYAAQYGVLGLVLIMLMTGYLWAKPSVDEMRNRQEAERKLWKDEVIPAIKTLTSELQGVRRELELRRGGDHEGG